MRFYPDVPNRRTRAIATDAAIVLAMIVFARDAGEPVRNGQLLRHTDDPLGNLNAERYDALVRAALEDAGLRA